jgi:undecaprenyl diphosphate synthase
MNFLNDKNKLPKHIAVILDGNGRWAKLRNLSRSEGHRKGGENLKNFLDIILELQIPFISLYTFSTENWKRPQSEILSLWNLMEEFFSKYLSECLEKKICIKISGDITKLPKAKQKILLEAIEKTKKNKNLVANFCINYGSHQEILYAVNKIIEEKFQKFQHDGKWKKINEKEFEKYLYTYPLPPVDLLIRPGGEYRISNFLLWQCAYAEFYFTDTLWPDFSRNDLYKALEWYSKRERRFGGLISV